MRPAGVLFQKRVNSDSEPADASEELIKIMTAL